MDNTTLDQLKDSIEEIRKVMQTTGKDLILKSSKELFEKSPNLKEVTWVQFTPYFNDGEPCVFSVGGVYFKMKGEPAEDEDEDDTYDFYEWDTANSIEHYEENKNVTYKPDNWDATIASLTPEGAAGLSTFGKTINTLGKEMESIFGDGFRVRITKNGIDVEEFEHD